MAYNNFKPMIWEKMILEELRKELVLDKFCNRKYEGDLKNSKSVKILGVGSPTIGTYTGGPINPPEDIADNSQILEIEYQKYFNVGIDDVDKAQSIPGLMEQITKECAYSMADEADGTIAKVCATTATHVSDPLTITTAEDMRKAVNGALTVLYELNVRGRKLELDISPQMYQLFKESLVQLMTDNMKILSNGIVGMYDQVTVRMTNNLYDDGTYIYAIIRTNNAQAYADQINKTEAFRPHDSFKDALKGLHVYGTKIIRPNEVYILKIAKEALAAAALPTGITTVAARMSAPHVMTQQAQAPQMNAAPQFVEGAPEQVEKAPETAKTETKTKSSK